MVNYWPFRRISQHYNKATVHLAICHKTLFTFHLYSSFLNRSVVSKLSSCHHRANHFLATVGRAQALKHNNKTISIYIHPHPYLHKHIYLPDNSVVHVKKSMDNLRYRRDLQDCNTRDKDNVDEPYCRFSKTARQLSKFGHRDV